MEVLLERVMAVPLMVAEVEGICQKPLLLSTSV